MLLVEWKQNNLLNEVLTLESIAIEAMPGHNNNNNDNDNVNDNENDNDKNNNFI